MYVHFPVVENWSQIKTPKQWWAEYRNKTDDFENKETNKKTLWTWLFSYSVHFPFSIFQVCFSETWKGRILTERGHAVNVMSKNAQLLTHQKNVKNQYFFGWQLSNFWKMSFYENAQGPKIPT